MVPSCRTGGGQVGDEVAQEPVDRRALRAVIGAAGDDANPRDDDDQAVANCTAMKAPEEMPEIELSLMSAL